MGMLGGTGNLTIVSTSICPNFCLNHALSTCTSSVYPLHTNPCSPQHMCTGADKRGKHRTASSMTDSPPGSPPRACQALLGTPAPGPHIEEGLRAGLRQQAKVRGTAQLPGPFPNCVNREK